MAILRGGRRIGNYDIRVGFPRDRSLDNVEGDRRLKRVQGPTKETFIGRVMGAVAQGEGFARPTKFMCDFILPPGVAESIVKQETERSTLVNQLNAESEVQRGLRAYVEAIDMPGRTLDTVDFKTYVPIRQLVSGLSFSCEITMSVYCDKYLRQRSFFEMWQKATFDQGTNNVHFYDEYTGGLRIYQLGAFAGNDDKDRIAYGVELFEVFPKTISAVSYSNEAENQIQKISVSLAFRNWINITMDRNGSYTTGGPYQKPVVIGANKGLIGGLLSKLPPELQRAGRQVTNIIRQRVPIGEVTGGRVFPPLF